MSKILENLRYSKDHEWVLVEGDVATVGITDYAQEALGDVVYVDLPRVGDSFNAHEAVGSVESVKAVSEIFTPIGGEIVAVNDGVNDSPENVNGDCYGEGWMIKVKMSNAGEVDAMLSSVEYEEYLSANA
ncbi:MAG: glycine cleavage system protein GcvH [Pyrinomonadaceae bacterium]|jgi:glycine cleavage system H protein|nr:glycine cleavage system protein GcvH [Pyrinomonadaceae bacterium]